jgi:hypothetical protein
MAFHVPNKFRLRKGELASEDSDGNQGAFVWLKNGIVFACIACDQEGWEHVSVTLPNAVKLRTPTWEEMCYVKSIFWDKDDVVMQLHPAESEAVNVHNHCLHLWRPTDAQIPIPPVAFV